MIISAIVAIDKNFGIGKDNQMMWHISDDLKNFKRITMNHHILMGRKTFDSIGKPLPGRKMLVLSQTKKEDQENLLYFSSMDTAIKFAEKNGEEEIFVIGGEQIYKQSMDKIEKLYLTQVQTSKDADAYFPSLNWDEWNVIEEQNYSKDEKNPYDWSFTVLERKK